MTCPWAQSSAPGARAGRCTGPSPGGRSWGGARSSGGISTWHFAAAPGLLSSKEEVEAAGRRPWGRWGLGLEAPPPLAAAKPRRKLGCTWWGTVPADKLCSLSPSLWPGKGHGGDTSRGLASTQQSRFLWADRGSRLGRGGGRRSPQAGVARARSPDRSRELQREEARAPRFRESQRGLQPAGSELLRPTPLQIKRGPSRAGAASVLTTAAPEQGSLGADGGQRCGRAGGRSGACSWGRATGRAEVSGPLYTRRLCRSDVGQVSAHRRPSAAAIPGHQALQASRSRQQRQDRRGLFPPAKEQKPREPRARPSPQGTVPVQGAPTDRPRAPHCGAGRGRTEGLSICTQSHLVCRRPDPCGDPRAGRGPCVCDASSVPAVAGGRAPAQGPLVRSAGSSPARGPGWDPVTLPARA